MELFPEFESVEKEKETFSFFVEVFPIDGGGRLFTYGVPSSFIGKIVLGSFVRVPLSGRIALGIVWKLNIVPDEKIIKKIRPIHSFVYDSPVLTDDLIKLCDWISEYYASAKNSVLQILLPAVIRRGVRPIIKKTIELVRVLSNDDFAVLKKRARRQADLYEYLLKVGGTADKKDLAEKGKFSVAVCDGLIEAGIVNENATQISRMAYEDEFSEDEKESIKKIIPQLNEEQSLAVQSIEKSLDNKKFHVHLLHGVTGSGKTEVFIQAIRKVLKEGGSVIFLVPEVALTPQTVERLRSRVKDCNTKTVIWHSNLSSGERFDAWTSMLDGSARLLVGARSAIFAPMKNLQLIVVDEEHEPSFKQGETPFYNGRDVAVYRAHLCGAVCILGSATPSLESFYNASIGKYTLNRISKRVDDVPFPTMKIIDMRQEILHSKGQITFSRPLLEALKIRLARKEQSILFLNRRGYSRSLICPDCGNVIMCPNCSLPMTYHKTTETLRCHLCDYTSATPTYCPNCRSDALLRKGFGTQRVEELLTTLLPDAKFVRLDADTMQKKNEFRRILNDFKLGKIDILLGTQMIAKGLDFPRVTLVGMLDADLSLYVPDFRAAERTFQLLVQVAGRAGRGQLEGEVFVQTFTPFSAPIQYAKRAEFDLFLEEELEKREEYGYPPKRHVIRHIFRSSSDKLLERECEKWAAFLEKEMGNSIEIRGPSPCPIEKIKNTYRYHIWYFCDKVLSVINRISTLRSQFNWHEDIVNVIDVDSLESS